MRLHRATFLRTCAALLVAGGGLAAVAAPSHAATRTDPLAPVTQPLTGVLTPLPVPLPSATSLPALPLPTGTSTTGSGGSTPAATGTGTGSSGSATSSGGGTSSARSGTAANKSRPARASGSTQPAASAAADTPAASLCIFASSGSAPAFEVTAKALGADLSSPLVERFPQAFAPCPAGAVPAGDHVAAVDATVRGLLGACVRVTRQVVPVQTTLVVLDQDVIRELTASGLPLQQLVVPCPGGSAAHAPVSQASGPHGTSSLTEADQVSALSALGRLAFTGGNVLPTLATGVGLILLGALLVRTRRLVPVQARR
ncbi:hypothetical protein ACFUC1_01100 [Pedococcus sp. NPDC057267]|uniref:hypothetical protein n=1 Tax=Pedococcus sp. NPDC057267 TaxID=3346077 RepID=UPI0036428B7A